MNKILRIGVAVAAVLWLAACESGAAKPAAVTKVASITSFGMCAGYCKATLEITEKEAVLIREQLEFQRGAGADVPPRRVETPLSSQEWQDIAAAAAAAKIETCPTGSAAPTAPTSVRRR